MAHTATNDDALPRMGAGATVTTASMSSLPSRPNWQNSAPTPWSRNRVLPASMPVCHRLGVPRPGHQIRIEPDHEHAGVRGPIRLLLKTTSRGVPSPARSPPPPRAQRLCVGVARGRDRRLWAGAQRRDGRRLGVARRGSDGCRTRIAAGPGRGLFRRGSGCVRFSAVRRALTSTWWVRDHRTFDRQGSRPPCPARRSRLRATQRLGRRLRPHPRAGRLPAIATTSAGIAWSCGVPDGGALDRDTMLEHVGRIVAAVGVPVTADLEAGYGDTPDDVGRTVARAVELGAVGANLEDAARSGYSASTRPSTASRPPGPRRPAAPSC